MSREVHVACETGRLRSVLVHEPGAEVDEMVPAMMEELLFDDIVFGERARGEHRRLRRVLQLLDVEAVESGDLLEQALARPEAREWLLDALGHDLLPSLAARLREAEPKTLARLLVTGVRIDHPESGVDPEELFAIAPLPNWCFQRDPQVVVGGGVAFAWMATAARFREALLARAIFRFHPELSRVPVLFDAFDHHAPVSLGLHRPQLEGGDVLVLSPEIVAVGDSARTNRAGVLALARALARRDGGPRWLYGVELPRRRAYMHLDTLFTPADRDACLVYPPVMLRGGHEPARVYEIDLHSAELVTSPCEDLFGALERRGLSLEPIPCGGPDPIDQQREQWTDGANALALAPGKVLLYDRNVRTAEELARRGFRMVQVDDLLLGRAEVELDQPGRACILLASTEISRARGGPHCLTHPLLRDAS
ncbi:MAG: hypothetical protein KBD01_02555 [Acidobacteria bacterium]|nr:hypothetical protein [Acidobacteriota bacterium]